MKSTLTAALVVAVVSLAGVLFLLYRVTELESQLRTAEFTLNELVSRSPNRAGKVAGSDPGSDQGAMGSVSELESKEATVSDDKLMDLPASVEHFVGEQRKVYGYIMAKVDYLFDSARLLETLTLLRDSTPEERARLQQELDVILNRRAKSKFEFEEATRKHGKLVQSLIEEDGKGEQSAAVPEES